MTHEERRKAYSEYVESVRSGDTEKAHEKLLEAFNITQGDITDICDDAIEKPLMSQERMLAIMSEDLRDLRDFAHINTPRQSMLSVFTDISDMEANKDYTILP